MELWWNCGLRNWNFFFTSVSYYPSKSGTRSTDLATSPQLHAAPGFTVQQEPGGVDERALAGPHRPYRAGITPGTRSVLLKNTRLYPCKTPTAQSDMQIEGGLLQGFACTLSVYN